jgi:hypothetical protein
LQQVVVSNRLRVASKQLPVSRLLASHVIRQNQRQYRQNQRQLDRRLHHNALLYQHQRFHRSRPRVITKVLYKWILLPKRPCSSISADSLFCDKALVFSIRAFLFEPLVNLVQPINGLYSVARVDF